MKKLFAFVALICAVSFSAGAQSGSFNNPSNSTGTPDTAVNAGTMYLTAKATNAGTITVQLYARKVSGTVAGSASLQASIDGDVTPASWYAVPGTDTLTLTDGDNVKAWVVPSNALNYRIRYTTSGTQRSTPKGYYLIRKHF